MAQESLHMRIGGNLGDILLDIAQDNIDKGNIEKALNTYTDSLQGFTNEYALMCLKNKAMLVVDEENQTLNLEDDKNLLEENAKKIYDWSFIIDKRMTDINNILCAIYKTTNDFMKLYNGNIEDYSILDMMKRYHFTDDQLRNMGLHNIAARILGSPDGKICDKGSSNPTSIWNKIEYAMETEDNDLSNWEKILFYTVHYNKLIKMLHKEYIKFEPTYLFLVENKFIKKPSRIEHMIEMAVEVLWKFSDTSTGYYHPLCNTCLYDYKERLSDDLMKTKFGKEFAQNGILKKDIMDGYDAGWLSPDGEFYGADGETSSMIHMTLAEQIFNAPTNKYAVRMAKDGVSIVGGIDSPEYWLEGHGWVKIHHNDIYGSFIGERDPAKRTKDFPYHYCPTEIQIKMICDYADKFYGGKFYTEANAFGRTSHPDPYTTYKVRQMDEFKIHEIFGR